MDEPPDLKLDAYLLKQGQRGPLCDVQVWLPKQPAENGRIQVQAFGLPFDNDLSGAGFSLVNDEMPGFFFEASDVLIRSSSTQFGRRAGGTTLEIEFVGRLIIRRNLRAQGCPELRFVESVEFWLSQLHYAIPKKMWRMHFDGSRSFSHAATPPRLLIHDSSGTSIPLDLDRHWIWVQHDDGDTVVAKSVPVFSFHPPSEFSASFASLRESAKVAALLLSLAARWRVLVHGVHAFAGGVSHEEWDYPLSRVRAENGLEGGAGFLVHPRNLADFLSSASLQLGNFGESEREAVYLTIYSIHPTFQHSSESHFLACFVALEGLARQFGQAKGGMHVIIPALLAAYPPRIVGLWPILGERGLPGLKDLRNELAHGRNFSRGAPGSLSVATDHLQLWIEYLLLTILNGRSYAYDRNWLAQHAMKQRSETELLRTQLRDAGVVSKT